MTSTLQPIRVVLLGDPGVGKSTLIQRYIIPDDQFINTQLNVDFIQYKTKLQNKDIRLQIWDAPCYIETENYASYVSGAHVIILVYDVTSKRTVRNLSIWLSKLNTFFPNIPKYVVGNKYDLFCKRVICSETAEDIVNKFKVQYVETSASNNFNVTNLFEMAVQGASTYCSSTSKNSPKVCLAKQSSRLRNRRQILREECNLM